MLTILTSNKKIANLVIFLSISSSQIVAQTPYKYELISNTGNSQETLFSNAIDWFLGYKRDYKIKKLKSESFSGDEQIIHWESNGKQVIQTSNSVVLKAGARFEISFTMRIEVKDDQYVYLIDNVYYLPQGRFEFEPMSEYMGKGNSGHLNKLVDTLRERFDAYLDNELIPSFKLKMKRESFKIENW